MEIGKLSGVLTLTPKVTHFPHFIVQNEHGMKNPYTILESVYVHVESHTECRQKRTSYFSDTYNTMLPLFSNLCQP